IAGSLEALIRRLRTKLRQAEPPEPLEAELDKDFEALDETAEEWPAEDGAEAEPLSEVSRAAIEQEIADLERFRALALSIKENAKGKALLVALERAFAEAQRLGAARKAIIFTESRRTQEYLLRVLSDSPFRDGLALFNGSNTDEGSRRIYAEWLARHAGTDQVTGSKTADMRSALVDFFREQGQIMIATEAGAEGINLQFCSLVVNYDLPWNPQRIEQRIGRCHRYGQQHDVVVVNFLNRKNEADQRVFELLAEKFQLFEGVFGSSDEVLGAIESGVDFEKRIADIYQRCRRPEEIKAAFDQLQLELSAQINDAMTHTRQQLLENFDDEVREKLRVRSQESREYLNRFEQMLMRLTRHELNGRAEFVGDSAFRLNISPLGDAIPLGLYELPRRSNEAHLYRLGHPLAQYLIEQAKARPLPSAEVAFSLSDYEGKIAALESFHGQAGALALALFTVTSLDQVEDYLLLAAVTDAGATLDYEAARHFFSLPARVTQELPASNAPPQLDNFIHERQQAIRRDISQRNAAFFEAEAEKLDGWADDLKVGLEREIKELDRQIKEARRAATATVTLEEKLAGQKLVKALEAQRNTRRRALFDAQDEIDRRRGELIVELEGKLQQRASLAALFTLRWRLE
ncbi:MAG: helicase-related protein, partial [Chloroflexota bacterium]